MASPATPPTTPPTIAPVCEEEEDELWSVDEPTVGMETTVVVTTDVNWEPLASVPTIVLISVLVDVLWDEVVGGAEVVGAEDELEELELVDVGIVDAELDVSGGGVVEEGDVVGGVVVGGEEDGGEDEGGGVVVGVPEGVVEVLGSEEL